MTERKLLGASGFIYDGKKTIQRVIVPESTLDKIEQAGGLRNLEGQVLDLIPEIPGSKLIGVYDIFVTCVPEDPTSN